MPRAVNPETGEVLFLVDDQWVPPSQTAKNEAGEAAYLVNNQWVLPGKDYTGLPAGTSNPFMGAVGRASELVGSGVEAVARMSEKAGDALETALPISNLSPEEIKNKRQLEPMFQFADRLKNVSKDIGYTPTTKLADLGDNPLTVIPFVAERIISSTPDMAAAVAASPAYIMSLTNEILNDRLTNDNKTLADATVKDVSLALGAAFAQGKFEKFATNRLLKGGTKGATTTGRIAKEAGIQFGTEGIEEGIDYLGRTVDTKKGVNTRELLESMAEGAITGGGLGVTVQGSRELLNRNQSREIEAEKEVLNTLAQEEARTAPAAMVPPDELQDRPAMLQEVDTGVPMTPFQPIAPEPEPRPEYYAGTLSPTTGTPGAPIIDPTTGAEVYPNDPRYAEVSRYKGMPQAAPAAPQAIVPEITPEPPPQPMVVPGLQTFEVPVKDLAISKDVPQFKSGARADTGVVEPLGGKFERTGVAPIQLWQRNNGQLEVISGRHRLDLAKRSGEETIPAQVHREADGFDVNQAAALDALLNIREGQGKVKDYVTYFQRPGYTREEAESSGVLARSTGQRAYSIATNGSSDLIAAHRADVITDEAATRIANSAPKEDSVQALGMKLIQEGKSINNAVNMMQAVKAIAGGRGEQTTDMFGFDDSAMKEAEEMARIASRKQTEISQDLSAVTGASKRPEVAKKYGVDVKDPASLQAKIDELRQQKMAWENWSSDPELVTQIQNEIRGVEPEVEVAPEVDTSTPSMFESRNTVEQDKAADSVLQRHQTKFKGASIAYRNGDLTLIKTMNPRTGAVIYTPAKGASYPTIPYEITSDEGRKQLTAMGLSTAEKRELVLERQRLEAEAQAKHEKTPYLKLKDGVNASDAVPKNMLGVVKSWAKLLNLQGKIYITTVDEAAANKDKYTGPHRTIGNLGVRAGTGVTIKLEDGVSVIVFKKNSSITQNLETIAHEMGHIHEKQVFNNAPPETQAAIKKAYAQWKAGITPKTPAKDMVESLRAKKTAQTTTIPEGVVVGDIKDISYWTGFNEWYADQVARWSVSSEKPVTVVDKFFAKLAAALRRFYNTVKGQKYLPNETFKQYLDTIASKAQFDSLIEEKAPKGQMALFSEGEVKTKTNTPQFKKWFGDSKVVDENGQPKVMYHGTTNFVGQEFKPSSKVNRGSNIDGYYFTSEPQEASNYSVKGENGAVVEGAEVIPVYLSLKNPFVKGSRVTPEMIQVFKEEVIKNNPQLGERAEEYANNKAEIMKEYGDSGRRSAPEIFPNISFPTAAKQRVLKAGGYDGFQDGGSHWVAFDANQIKSAIGNTGAYSPESNEIQLSRSEVEAEGPTGIQKLNKIRRNYRGEIVSPETVWSIPDDSKMERFIYKIQDKFIDTKRVIQAIKTQISDITDKWDAYLKEELYHGRAAKRTKDFLQNELLPIVRGMRDANISVIEFDAYLHARHAEERNKQIAKINPEFLKDGSPNPNWMPDGGSGMTTQNAIDYLAKLQKDQKKLNTLEALASKVDKLVQDTQKILFDSGLESQETIDTWNNTYKRYVPLMRKDLDFAQDFTGLGSGFQVKGSASKRAYGSFKEVADIFANIASQRERAIVRAEKARVGNAIYGLAIMNPNTDFWLPVNPDAIKDPEKLVAELENMGIDPRESRNLIQEPQVADTDPQTGTVVYKVNPILRNSPNVFSVRIGGQQRYIFFNPSNPRAMRMVQAIKNLDAEEMGWALGNAAKVTRWIASVNTQYNPVFGAYNFIRDTLGAQFNLSTTPLAGKQAKVSAGVLPALRGIYVDLRSQRAGEGAAKGEWAKLWEEYQKEGGATGYRDQFSKNRDEQNLIEREMANLEKGNVKKGVAAVFNWLSDYNDAMENAVRLSAYKVAITPKAEGGGGLSKERAASLAKNLTVNFNRKGERAQQLGALYAFFNASVQGSARLAETLKGPSGKKIIGGGLLLGSVQALSLAMMGFKDDEPSEFVKERNLIIPFPNGTYIAIPMPLGLHVIPNIGRITTEMVLTGGKDVGEKTANLTGVLMDAFNPIGNSGLSMQTLSPTMLDPIAAIIENKDTFGRPIAREDRATNPTPGYTRTRETASYLGKELSYFLNIASGGTKYQKGMISPTPDQIDFLAGQATGGVGREISKTEQAITAAITGEELPSYKVPLVGKFYGDVTSQASQANRFYDNITKMANYENELKGRQKDRVSTADFMREHPEARLYQRANQLENEISKLNREKKALVEQGADKSRIKSIEERKTRIMTQFNNQVENLQK